MQYLLNKKYEVVILEELLAGKDAILMWCNYFFITKTCLFKYTKPPKKKRKISDKKNSDIFHVSAQNIDCGYSLEQPHRGGFNEYPQSMFLSRNKKNNVYPCKPLFYYIKVGFKGGQNYIGMFSWC